MACTSKARNLIQLQQLGFRVPRFSVISALDAGSVRSVEGAGPFMLRSCMHGEDGALRSLAGQGKSVGPIERTRVLDVLDDLFVDPRIAEVIVQEFRDEPTGVLFCTGPSEGYLEYSRVPSTVTNGQGKPYVAVFPNRIPRYAEIATLIPQLFAAFGPCDVELSIGQPVHLLQVRPITAALKFDRDAATARMILQEQPFQRLEQDEFCHDLSESPESDAALIEAYCAARRTLIEELGLDGATATPRQFIKIGRQVGVDSTVAGGIRLAPEADYAVARWSAETVLQKWLSEARARLEAVDLMRCAMALRAIGSYSEQIPLQMGRLLIRKVVKSRNRCRALLLSKLERKSLAPACDGVPPLKFPIHKDDALCMWRLFEVAHDEGQVVVAGAFDQGPYREWIRDMSFPEEKVVLVCDALYPDIYRHFDRLSGIICESGALTSHLAILAREEGMPLWIQVPDALRRFAEVSRL